MAPMERSTAVPAGPSDRGCYRPGANALSGVGPGERPNTRALYRYPGVLARHDLCQPQPLCSAQRDDCRHPFRPRRVGLRRHFSDPGSQSAIFRIDDDLQCAIAERACFRRSSLKKFIVLARKPASVCAPAEFGQALLLPRTTNPKVRDFM
jgi:hypothetical protein